ncbi:MAG: DUF721 domain-containing protein [Armatimonadetes bacterium]|nr:DUF721 domain-containing protein [Armatimonadota bacterium]
MARFSDGINDNWSQFGSVMERVLSNLGLDRELQEWRALQRWPEAVGPRIAARVKAVRVQNGVLWVQSGPHWAAEVSVRKEQLLEKLNEGSPVLKDIRFIGAWDRRRKDWKASDGRAE